MTLNTTEVLVRKADGALQCLGDYKGQVLLIVNVASKCGFTKQYAGLQALQDRYRDQNFTVLGFPCNDFGNQEPGSLKEIKDFCSATYGANFELFDKVHAIGNTTEPYTTLNQFEPAGDIEWNFEKFLVGKNCKVIARFKSNVEPDSNEIKSAIEIALKA